MPRILITGVGGFVGRHAMAALATSLPSDARLAGIGRHLPPDNPQGMRLETVDLLDRERVSAFVAEFAPTHVLHLAGLTSVHQAKNAQGDTWRANVLGLLNLAEAVVATAPGSTFLFVSSGEVYGRAFLAGTPLDETVLPVPANIYARTKHAGEMMLGDLLPSAGIKLVVLRPFNHIGPGQDERFVVASFAAQIARIEAGLRPPVLEVGDLSARRDFLDVSDVVAAYTTLIRQAERLPDVSLFNISSGRARPIAELLDGLQQQAKVPFEIRVSAERLRPSEIPTASGDASALSRAIDWEPRVPLDKSLLTILSAARRAVAE